MPDTNPDLTEIILVLDRSGSMDSIKSATIESLNSFLREQRSVPGGCNVTVVQFDSHTHISTMYTALPVGAVPFFNDANYLPGGTTALLDAIGRTIDEVGARFARTQPAGRPGKVVFTIMTDGLENDSKHYTKRMVFDMISHQREKYSWEFVFLGANQDAIAEGAKLGIPQVSTMTFNATEQGVHNTMDSYSSQLSSYRMGNTVKVSFNDEDRKKALNQQ